MKTGLLAFFLIAFACVPINPAMGSGCESHATRIFKVRTCEIDRSSYKKWAYDRCGKRYSYWVTVITYKDVYSNGSYRIRKEIVS